MWIRSQSPILVRYHDGEFRDVPLGDPENDHPITALTQKENGESRQRS